MGTFCFLSGQGSVCFGALDEGLAAISGATRSCQIHLGLGFTAWTFMGIVHSDLG